MDFYMGKNRIQYRDDDNNMLAEVTFPFLQDGVICIDHTFVDESLRGQGIADKLIRHVAEYARDSKLKVVPQCSYAVKWFEKNSEYQDVVK